MVFRANFTPLFGVSVIYTNCEETVDQILPPMNTDKRTIVFILVMALNNMAQNDDRYEREKNIIN